jgi:hypothetical protein
MREAPAACSTTMICCSALRLSSPHPQKTTCTPPLPFPSSSHLKTCASTPSFHSWETGSNCP